MPRIQLFLPDDLYKAVKARRLEASDLLQKAARAELRRLDLLEAGNRYLNKLVAGAGLPGRADRPLTARVATRAGRKVG